MQSHDTSHAANRRKLSDILSGGADSLRDQWATTEAATDFAPMPAGTYTARVIAGELTNARSGTPGYKLTFRVIDGEHAGRQFWHDVWLTQAALPMAKRDLGKLGVTSLEQLEAPLPPGIRCSCKLALRRDDDGSEYNRVRSFDVIAIEDDPTADPDFGDDPHDSGGNDDPAGAMGSQSNPEPSDGTPVDKPTESDAPQANFLDTASGSEATPTRSALEAGR